MSHSASSPDKFITSVERKTKRDPRMRREPAALTPRVTRADHSRVPPTPNTASQMAGLLSPGYPLGTDPARTACHAQEAARLPLRHAHDHSSRHRTADALGPDEYTYEFDGPDSGEFDALLFISSLPATSPIIRNPIPCPLPRKAADDRRVTLVLDLDETLVHCSTDASSSRGAVKGVGGDGPAFTFEVPFNGLNYNVAVNVRPYMREFLEWAAQRFEVVVFTASQRVYADKLLDILDPGRRLISHRAFRDSCICVEGNFLKDLTVLGRDLSRLVIVDNSPQAFSYQLDNGIPIESWFDCPKDTELMKLRPMLQQIANAGDVRDVLRRKFQLRDKVVERYALHKKHGY